MFKDFSDSIKAIFTPKSNSIFRRKPEQRAIRVDNLPVIKTIYSRHQQISVN